MAKLEPVSYEVNIRAKPLTAAERQWVEDLNRILQACPSKRIAAYTIGDNNLTLYDAVLERRPDIRKIVDAASDFCIGVHETGIRLATVYSTFNIDSTAG